MQLGEAVAQFHAAIENALKAGDNVGKAAHKLGQESAGRGISGPAASAAGRKVSSVTATPSLPLVYFGPSDREIEVRIRSKTSILRCSRHSRYVDKL